MQTSTSSWEQIRSCTRKLVYIKYILRVEANKEYESMRAQACKGCVGGGAGAKEVARAVNEGYAWSVLSG